MKVIVQKYGGISVATRSASAPWPSASSQPGRRGNDVVVVVSAMGDTTDELIALARQVTRRPGRRASWTCCFHRRDVSATLMAMALHGLGSRRSA